MKKVALVMGLSDFYDHRVARGIVRYAKEQGDWKLFGHGWMFNRLNLLQDWKGDGLIIRREFADSLDPLTGYEGAVVDVANAYSAPGVQSVCNDDYRTGERAGRFFLEKGYASFAFCGALGTSWSDLRLKGFLDRIGLQQIPVFERSLSWWLNEPYSLELALFLASLPKPSGLLACNDKTALRVSAACRAENISVPDQISILGVDNEDIPCELSDPPLSSVLLQLEQVGYEAARKLHRLMDGEEFPGEPLLIPPAHIIERNSTALLGFDDDLIARSYRILQAESGHLNDVNSLTAALAVSRRTLESHFKRETGKTVHEAIVDQRIRVATGFLHSTDRKLEDIAREAGFGSLQAFFRHFKEHFGTTPNGYRKQLKEIYGGNY
ncbi:MAG: substrate-binding domain-containing protein [Spirochaetales bacterium]|nr:substrate-binding domain-containing protein [Spirochaetales bacterium]